VAVVRAHAPQRNRAQLVGRARTAVLYDAVAGADVVEQEVAVGVNDLVAEGGRNRERAAVDDSSCQGNRFTHYLRTVAYSRFGQLLQRKSSRVIDRVARFSDLENSRLAPGTSYSKIVSNTMAGKTAAGPVSSFGT